MSIVLDATEVATNLVRTAESGGLPAPRAVSIGSFVPLDHPTVPFRDGGISLLVNDEDEIVAWAVFLDAPIVTEEWPPTNAGNPGRWHLAVRADWADIAVEVWCLVVVSEPVAA